MSEPPTDDDVSALLGVVRDLDDGIGRALCGLETRLSDAQLKRCIMSAALIKFAWRIAEAAGLSKDVFLTQVSANVDVLVRRAAEDAARSVVH